MAEKEINIRIESLFNDAGFARAIRAVQGLQREIGKANAGMQHMATIAREVSQSMSQAAASMSSMGDKAQAASGKMGKFVDATRKAAASADTLDKKTDQAAAGVTGLATRSEGLSRSLVAVSSTLATVTSSTQALANQNQIARRATEQFYKELDDPSIIDAKFRIIETDEALKRLTAGARQAAEPIKALGAGTQTVSRHMNTMGSSSNTTARLLAKLNGALGLSRQFLSQFTAIGMQAAKSLGGALPRALVQATKSLGGLLSQGARFASLRSSLDATGRSASRFGSNFDKGMKQANRSAMEFYAAGWSLLMGGQMIGGVGKRILGGIGGQLDEYLEFEKARTKLGIASSDFESGQQIPTQQHNQLLNEMIFGIQQGKYGAPIPMASQDIAQGAYYFSSALGTPITNEEQAASIAKALVPILATATYTQTSPETAIKGVLNAAMEFGIDPRAKGSDVELAKIAGQFGYLTQLSTVELPDIIQTFKMMGPMVNELGGPDNHQNLNDAMLMTFLTSEMGQRGSMPGRGLRQAMNSFIDPTAKMDTISEDLFGGGVRETFFDENMDLKGGLTGFLAPFVEMDEGDWQKAVAGMFTTNATSSLLAVIRQMRSDPDKVAKFLEGIEGEGPLKLTDAAIARYNDSVAGHLQQVKNAWFEMQAAVITAVEGPLKRVLTVAANLFRQIAAALRDHPQIAKFFSVFAAGIGTVLTLVGTLLTFAGTLLILRRAFMLTHGSMNIVMALFTSLPHLLLVSIPILLVLAAAAVLLYRAWQSNFGGIQDIVASFSGDMSGRLDPILTTIEDLSVALAGMFSDEVNAQFDRFLAWLPTIHSQLMLGLGALKAFGKGAVEGIVGTFMTLAAVARVVLGILQKVPTALQGMTRSIKALTGFNGSLADLAHIMGIAFGALVGGKIASSLIGFNSAIGKATTKVATFVFQHVILGTVTTVYRVLGTAADVAFNIIIKNVARAVIALGTFIFAQTSAAASTLITIASVEAFNAAMILGATEAEAMAAANVAAAAATRTAWLAASAAMVALVVLVAAVVVAFLHLMATNEDFRVNVISAFRSIISIVLDFVQGALTSLIIGIGLLSRAIEPVLQVLLALLAPILALADGMNVAYYAGFALGAVMTALAVRMAIALVASLVTATANVIALGAQFTILAVQAIAAAVSAIIAWIAAAGPAALIIAGLVVVIGALLVVLDQLGVIDTPFSPIVDGANLAIAAVSLLFDWLVKTNDEQLEQDERKAFRAYKEYDPTVEAQKIADQRYAQAKSDAEHYRGDRIHFPNDPNLQSAYEQYANQESAANRIPMSASGWFDNQGMNHTPSSWTQSFYDEALTATTQVQQDLETKWQTIYDQRQQQAKADDLARSSETGTTQGGVPRTGFAWLDGLLGGLSLESITKTLGFDINGLTSGLDVGNFASYEDFEAGLKKKAFDSSVAKKYQEITGRDLARDKQLDPNTIMGREALIRSGQYQGQGVDTDALNEATARTSEELDEVADAAGQAADAIRGEFATAIESIDLGQALKGIYGPYAGKGVSAGEALFGYSETIMSNLQNTVGKDAALPWQNQFELMMDAAGSGGFLGQNVSGKNLHEALTPFLETFAAQSGVAVESLLKDIPMFYAPEQYIGMGQANLIEAAQGLPTDMYKRLDLLGSGQRGTATYDAEGIDWAELANYGTAQAAAGNLKWDLADFIMEAWDLSRSEAEAYISANQLDPKVITGQDFFDTKLYADTLGGQVNVLPQEWMDYLMSVTQDGTDKTIEITQAAFDALPDVIKIGFSNMGYQFILGGESTSAAILATNETIKQHIEDTFGNIPDHLSKLLTQGWTAVDSDMDGLVEIRDELGNLKFTIPEGDYAAWIASNDALQKERDRLRGLKDDLETLKGQIRALATMRDDIETKAENAGSYSQFTTQVDVGSIGTIYSSLSQAKADAAQIRTDLGWITTGGALAPESVNIDMGVYETAGQEAAQAFSLSFTTELDTQFTEVPTVKIDVDRTDATTHYNEMVTALRDDYNDHVFTAVMAVDKDQAMLDFQAAYDSLQYDWEEDTFTTTMAVIDNASTTIGQAIGLLQIGFARTFSATITVSDYATWTIQHAVDLLNLMDGKVAIATITTNHNDNYTASGRGYAQGGSIFQSGRYLVGEYGPEMVHLPAGSRVSPNSLTTPLIADMVKHSVGEMVGSTGGYQSHQIIGGEGGGSGASVAPVTVNFYGDNHFHNGTDMDDLVERIDYLQGKRQEKVARGQYGGDSARYRTT